MRRARLLIVLSVASVVAALGLGLVPAGAASVETRVSVGSPPSPFAQNKQNEPSVAIDAHDPLVVAAGSNDEIDLEACNAGDPTSCPFTNGVGTSGIYFSFDGGHTWTQPTYSGWSARSCLGPAACVPAVGPIGTLPHYFENGLVSDGDPSLAFGPQPGPNGFSWANGSRLYYADLTSAGPVNPTLKGAEGIAVSRTDNVASAAAGNANAWMAPVVASKQASATFSDKEQIWADNAASSPFFGNVYVCFEEFKGSGAGPMVVLTSGDGGDSWASKQVSPAHAAAPLHWGQSGCTVRTDSHGVVYVFYEEFQNPSFVFPPIGTHFMVTSSDGGVSWTRPVQIQTVTDPCAALQFDGTSDRCVHDGVSGARDDLSASPNVSIANGAPTGAGATNEIVLNWVDGAAGVNHEHVYVRTSTDGGATWSAKAAVESPGDRGYYTAPALSPDGQDLYLVYNAFTTPFRSNTSDPRTLVGVVLHADVAGNGSLSNWSTLNRGAPGDPRASSQNNQFIEFLGDYVYAAATNDFGVAVWNDVRNAADCPAVDAWRTTAQSTHSIAGRPAPQQDCPATFGNTDIYGGSYADPS